MTRFNSQAQTIARLSAQIENIKARLSRISTPGGKLRIESTTIQGGIWAHDHTNEENGGKEEYVPTLYSNWNGSSDPGNAWQALDQLAARIKSLELSLQGVLVNPAQANTMLFNGME